MLILIIIWTLMFPNDVYREKIEIQLTPKANITDISKPRSGINRENYNTDTSEPDEAVDETETDSESIDETEDEIVEEIIFEPDFEFDSEVVSSDAKRKYRTNTTVIPRCPIRRW